MAGNSIAEVTIEIGVPWFQLYCRVLQPKFSSSQETDLICNRRNVSREKEAIWRGGSGGKPEEVLGTIESRTERNGAERGF